MEQNSSTLSGVIAVIRKQIPALPAGLEITEKTPLMEGGLGLDSVAAFEVIVACDEKFGVELPEELLAEDTNVGDLVKAIESALNSGEIAS